MRCRRTVLIRYVLPNERIVHMYSDVPSTKMSSGERVRVVKVEWRASTSIAGTRSST